MPSACPDLKASFKLVSTVHLEPSQGTTTHYKKPDQHNSDYDDVHSITS